MHRKHALFVRALAIGAIACRSQPYSHDGTNVIVPVSPQVPIAPMGSGGGAPMPPVVPTIMDAGGTMMSAQPMIAVDAAANDARPGAQADAGPEIAMEPSDDAAYLFDQSQIRTYNLVITPADLATIDANPEAEMYVPAMLEFEGKTYGPLSVRYKGSVGAWRPPCVLVPGANMPKAGKCSIKVAFDKPDDSARFYGVKKLNFHSMNADDSMLRERLGYALFREMGIAAPRSMHARLLINGKLEGLFIVVENIDGQFTRARFREGGKGNVYKEIWPMHDDPAKYIAALENNPSAATTAGVQKMVDFKIAIDDSEQAALGWIDRDYLLRYTAVDRVIINDDGAFHWWCEWGAQGNNTGSFGNHNYYWYEERNADRMWLVPWDLDTSFDGLAENRIELEWNKTAACMCVTNSQGTIEYPASCDRLTQYLIGWSKDYEATVQTFITTAFAAEPVTAKLDEWSAQIDKAVAEQAGLSIAKYAAWKSGVVQLRATIDSARTHHGYAY